jgi:hypothetical protein
VRSRRRADVRKGANETAFTFVDRSPCSGSAGRALEVRIDRAAFLRRIPDSKLTSGPVSRKPTRLHDAGQQVAQLLDLPLTGELVGGSRGDIRNSAHLGLNIEQSS